MIHRLLRLFGRHCSASESTRQSMHFVDLGLPSGTLWAERDIKSPTMIGCSLPSYEQAQELIECCDFYVAKGSGGRRFYCAQGPSGQFVYFPIEEYEGTPGPSGCCWCSGELSDEYGYFLLLSKVTITIGVGRKDIGFPCRMVRTSAR